MTPSATGLQAFRLDGRTAAITGGANGIGLACARLFSEAGAKVVLLDRDADALAAAARALAGSASALLDVADAEAVERCFAALAKAHGPLHVLVNNAGMAIRRASLELDVEDWNAVVAVNRVQRYVALALIQSLGERALQVTTPAPVGASWRRGARRPRCRR